MRFSSLPTGRLVVSPSPPPRLGPRAVPVARLEAGRRGQGQAELQEARHVLAKGKRYAIVMNTTCGTIRIVLDRKLGGAIPNSIAFLARSASSTASRSTASSATSSCRAAIPGVTARAGPATTSSASCRPPTATRSATSRWPRRRSTRRAPPGRSSSSSPGSTGLQLPPDYGLLGHATDRASLATIKRINGARDGRLRRPPGLPAQEAGLDHHRAPPHPALVAGVERMAFAAQVAIAIIVRQGVRPVPLKHPAGPFRNDAAGPDARAALLARGRRASRGTSCPRASWRPTSPTRSSTTS